MAKGKLIDQLDEAVEAIMAKRMRRFDPWTRGSARYFESRASFAICRTRNSNRI